MILDGGFPNYPITIKAVAGTDGYVHRCSCGCEFELNQRKRQGLVQTPIGQIAVFCPSCFGTNGMTLENHVTALNVIQRKLELERDFFTDIPHESVRAYFLHQVDYITKMVDHGNRMLVQKDQQRDAAPRPWKLAGKVISPAARFHHLVESHTPDATHLMLLENIKSGFAVHGPPQMRRAQ